jgi:Flp pilus assembly protein TadD
MHIAIFLILSATPLTTGCNSDTRQVRSNYRTITTEPLRDTEAAKKANQQGMKHLRNNELDKALAAFNRACEADVEYGPAHNNLGEVYYRKDDLYKAAVEFDAARRLMPDHPGPHNNLGLVREHGGEYDQAVQRYRQAVKLAPDNVEYVANLARVMSKRGDRSDEHRDLLRRILAEDKRPEWLMWAKRQLAEKYGLRE